MKILRDTKDVEHAIVQLLRGAEQEAWLVTPYISLEKLAWLRRAVQETLSRKVSVHLVVREDGSKTRTVEDEAKILVNEGLDLRCVPDLHAKVYWSEKSAIITSLNLLASSMNNSIEIGVSLEQGDAHAQIRQFIEQQVERNSQEMPESKREREREEERHGRLELEKQRDALREEERQKRLELEKQREALREEERQRRLEREAGRRAEIAKPRTLSAAAVNSNENGFCIRCGQSIPLNVDKPYCNSDFISWKRYENMGYEDKYCHKCGGRHPASMRKPLCPRCYSVSK